MDSVDPLGIVPSVNVPSPNVVTAVPDDGVTVAPEMPSVVTASLTWPLAPPLVVGGGPPIGSTRTSTTPTSDPAVAKMRVVPGETANTWLPLTLATAVFSD